MLTRNRQGWRLRTVLSRLAVAGLLTAGGTGFLQPDPAMAQAEVQAPPPTAPTRRPRPPDPVAEPSAAAETTVGPTPVAAVELDPAPAELPAASPSVEQLSAQRNSLNQVLCKDRRHQLLLQRGQSALSRGDVTSALLHLQALCEASSDAFYWPDDSAVPRGARTSVEALIRSLPPQQRQMCERLQGDLARTLLAESRAADGTSSLVDLLQRFSHTCAAREAMSIELLRAFDAGQSDLARQYAQRLAADEQHLNLLPAPHQALVHRLLEAAPRQQDEGDSPSWGPPALRPRWTYAFADGLQEHHNRRSLAPAVAEASTPPDEAGMSGRVIEAIVASASQWYSERQERRLPACTVNQASVVGEMLIVRDFAGLRAMTLRDGQTRWHYAARGALAEIAAAHVRTGAAAPLDFQAHFSGEGPVGRLTTDGERVFFLEELRGEEPQVAADGAPEPAARLNRLVALPLYPESEDVAPIWSHPAPGSDSLAGHRFLGPPLSVDGRLFVLTESTARLECIALDSADGRILWRQPVAIAPAPIAADPARMRIACSPVYSASTLVCPTEVGVLVGVDPLTGSLRWVYDQLDDEQRHAAGRWSSSTQRSFGSSEFPSRTLVHAGRIVHLPFRSASVHCVDAATGAPVWIAPREGALGLSAADDHNILLVGSRQVSSLSPTLGALQWTTPCPEPAGHGVIAGNVYLLPLSDGRCLSLFLEDGTPRGARFGRLLHQLAFPQPEPAETTQKEIQLVAYRPQSQPSPLAGLPPAPGGNLTAAGDLIVVTRPTEISVYPMSGALLAELTARSADGRLSDEEQLEAAMLHLLLEDRVAARSRLRTLVMSGRSPKVTAQATRLLREVLFAEVETADDSLAILDQIEELPADDTEALRLLVHRIDAAISRGDVTAVIASIEDLQSHPPGLRVLRDGHSEFAVNAWCDVGDRLAEWRADVAQPPSAQLDQYVSILVERAQQSNDVEYQRALARLFDGWPQAAVLRNDVAATDIASGRLQQAELQLLKNTLCADADAAARAHSLLVELYATAGLRREAAAHLLRLEEEFAAVDDGGSGRRRLRVARTLPDTVVRQLAQRQRVRSGGIESVQISEHVCDETCTDAIACDCVRAVEHHERIRRKFLTSDDSSLTVIDRGILSADRGQSTLALIDRESGSLQGELEVPAAYWHLAGGGEGYCGQLLPVSGRAAHGLSLLERRCLWSSSDADDRLGEKVRIGPIGHDYCVLQSPSRLAVVDPVTGEPLWFRDDISPEAGLLNNETTGIIGDCRTLTVFDADQLSYTVYRTKSGRLVRRGRLDLTADDSRRHRRAFGDRLVHLISGAEGDRLRVWRAASDEILCELPLHERLFARIPGCDRYAAISPDRELLIIDVATGDIPLRALLTADQLADAGELHVTADSEGYLVNLVGCEPEQTGDAVAAIDEVELPAMRVRGLLLRVSHQGGVQWSRQVPDAAALTSLHSRLPVLVLISRVRVLDHRQPSMLRVEVLDTRTGETLAVRGDLLRTRLVQVDERHPNERLKLIGLDSQIVLEFAPSPPSLRIHAELDPTAEVKLR